MLNEILGTERRQGYFDSRELGGLSEVKANIEKAVPKLECSYLEAWTEEGTMFVPTRFRSDALALTVQVNVPVSLGMLSDLRSAGWAIGSVVREAIGAVIMGPPVWTDKPLTMRPIPDRMGLTEG